MNKSILIIFLFVSACSSTEVKNKNEWSASAFDHLQIGQTKQEVKLLVGSPSEMHDYNNEENWFFREKATNFQSGTVSFDKKTGKALGFLYITNEAEPEINLDYLKKNKFPNSTFEKIPAQRCEKHDFPTEEYYFDVAHGIFIEVNSLHHTVESYGRGLPQEVAETLQKKKTCPKKQPGGDASRR